MKALSIQQPHSDEILFMGKDIENRNWALPGAMLGQRIYIRAGKRPRAGYSVQEDHNESRLGAILDAPFRHPLNAKKGPFSQDAPATQRLRDLATRQPCNEKDPLSGASSFNSQLARTTDPVFAPSAG